MIEKLIFYFFIAAVGTSMFVPTPTQMRSAFQDGQRLFVMEDYSGAIEKYEQVRSTSSSLLTEDSVMVDLENGMRLRAQMAATYQIGNAYRKLNEIDRAVDNFKLVEHGASNAKLRAMAQNQVLLARYQERDYEKVISEAQYLIENYPHEDDYVARAYYNMGWSYYELNRYEESASTFETMVDKYPDVDEAPKAQLQAGEAYFQIAQYEKALNAFAKFVDKYTPKQFNERQWSEIALDKLRLRKQVEGGTGKSREEKNVIKLSALAYHKIGDCYRELGDLNSAIDTYYLVTNNFTPLRDMVEKAYLKIAEIEYERSGIDGAISVYQAALDKSSDRKFQGQMQLQKAKLYYEKEVYSKSIDEYAIYIHGYRDIADQIEFPPAQAQYQIGHISFELQSYERAIPAYQTVLDSFPNQGFDAISMYEMGISKQNIKDFEGALATYRMIHAQFGEEAQNEIVPLSMIQSGSVYLQMKDYSRAIGQYRQTMREYGSIPAIDSSFVYFQLGLAFREQGTADSARTYFGYVKRESDFFAAAYSEIAEIYLSENKFDEAERALLSVTETLQDTALLAEFNYYLGRLYIKAERRDEALNSFSFAIDHLENSQLRASALYGRGVIYFDQKNYPPARDDFSELIASSKERMLINLAIEKLALSYFYTGETEKALALVQQRIDQAFDQQEKEELMLLQVRIYQQTKMYPDALALISQLTGEAYTLDTRIEALFYKSIITYAQANYGASIEAVTVALTLNPENKYRNDLYYQRGLAAYQTEEYAAAVVDFTEVLKRDQRYEMLLYSNYYSAYCQANLGNWSEAIRLFDELADRYPESDLAPEARFQVAEAYFNMKDYARAAAAYEKVVSKYPNTEFVVQSLYNRAWSLIEEDRLDEAIGQFRMLVEKYPDSEYGAFSQFSIADYYYNNKDYPTAREAYTVVINNYPEHELAQKAANLIHELDQIESFLAYDAAMKFFDGEDYPKAITELEAVIARFPDADVVAGALVNIAACHEQLGQWEDALRYYDRVITQYENNPDGRDAVQFAREHVNYIKENY
jgi:tetratricopeptide (TPR) repeat protein